MTDEQILKNKIEIISRKLIKLGYVRCDNPYFDSENRIENLIDGVGEDELNDMPNIVFDNNDYDICFFLKKKKVVIDASGEHKTVKDDNGEYIAELVETTTFKRIEFDDFYCLFVEKNVDLSIILNTSSN